jgi:hypothetical protein
MAPGIQHNEWRNRRRPHAYGFYWRVAALLKATSPLGNLPEFVARAAIVLATNVAFWPFASFRCKAAVRSLLGYSGHSHERMP